MALFGVAAALFALRWWLMRRRWRHMRAAAAAQDAEKEEGAGVEGAAIPRPPRLNEDEAYERGHSGAYNRDSVMWDVDASTIVGSRSSRATFKGRRKPHKINSRVGVMGEWVEPDSDEEGEEAGGQGSVAWSGSAKGSLGGGTESWATIRPRQVDDLDVLERANRTLSLAGVGAGENVRFIGADSEFGRPLSMPEIPGSPAARAYHRPTYSRADSEGVRAPLLPEGVRSPLGKTSFAVEELEMPKMSTGSSVDELARARPSVDVGLGEEKDDGAGTDVVAPPWNSSDNETPLSKGSIDITSPRSYLGQRPH
ncbi:hypothetical protein FRC08_017845 [Ceratobasidium sp. 394]|nr:hypothetical protein FRC08_017845 [Ceratobasidium sp. 394]